ncbi:MAG: hypothetical protein MZV70_76285 [Desulfobacterales bacterium]|nr:hypothetical protein [Desulfobacterales bacterium]
MQVSWHNPLSGRLNACKPYHPLTGKFLGYRRAALAAMLAKYRIDPICAATGLG